MSKDLLPETERIIIISIPLKDIIPPKGYLAFWSFKSYWFYYYAIVRSNFKTMRVGNIFDTIMIIPKGFVYAKYMLDLNLKKHRIPALHAFMTLVGKPLNYNFM